MRKTFKILIIQFFLGFSLLLNAQQGPYFNRAYDLSNGDDFLGYIQVYQDSLIFMFGSMEDTIPVKRSFTNVLFRLDLNGNVIWKQLITDTFIQKHGAYPVNSFAVSDNKIVIASNTSDSEGDIYTLVSAFDFNGVRLWQKKIEYDYYYSIEKNLKGYIACGYKRNDSLIYRHALLVQFDSVGNKVWEKIYDWYDVAFMVKLIPSPDGGIIAGCIRDDTLVSPSHDGNPAVVKTDSAGTIEWITNLSFPNSTGYTAPANITLTSDGYIIAASGQNIIRNYMQHYVGLMAKLKMNGQIIWQKQYGKSQNFREFLDIIELKSGNYLATGFYYGLKWETSGWIMETDTTGNLLLERLHRYSDSTNSNTLTTVGELYNHSLVAAGHVGYISPDTTTNSDLWAIRTDTNGCLAPGCDTCSYPVVSYSIERIDANTFRILNHFLPGQTGFISAYTLSPKFTSKFNYQSTYNDTMEYKVFEFTDAALMIEVCVEGECNLVSCITDSIPVYPLGIEESYFLNDIKVFPNPFSQVLQINFGQPAIKEMELQIIDISGRMLLQKTLPSGLQSFNVTTAAFPPGIYLYRIGTNELGWKSGKVFKTIY
jgi:Secretion system C-terminal sorting domain